MADDPDKPGKPDPDEAAVGDQGPGHDHDHDQARLEREAEVDRRVQRIPRGKFLRQRELMMILMLLVGLFCVLALRRPCARGVARMVDSFDSPDAGVPRLRKPR